MAFNAFSARNQVLQDSEELQFYLRDLKQWESQIKAKDRELLLTKSHSGHVAPSETRNEAKSGKAEFDAENACEDSEIDDEEMDLQRRQQAIVEKDKGNSYLKAGKLDEAISCYTKGYELDPYNALLPANRALAYIKKEQYLQAETDCGESLTIDPTYVKAYQRRAVARIALQKFALAKDDLLQVLKYEPKNKEAHNELLKLEQTYHTYDKTDVEAMGKTEMSESACKSADDGKRIEKKLVEVIETEAPSDTKGAAKPKTQNSSLPEVKLDTLPSLLPVPEVPPAPTSAFQFQTEFRRLKPHPEVLYKYIKQIPSSSYPQFFDHSLEYEIMSEMFRIFRDYYMWNNDDLYTPLLNLSKTKRFTALKLFMSVDDKKALREVFDYMKKTHDSPEQLNALIAAYAL